MDKKLYEEKIQNATPMGLVIITYEMLLEMLDEAQKAISNNAHDDASAAIVQAQKILRTLTTGLNMDIELSKELLDLYLYLSSVLIECQIKSYRVSQTDVVSTQLAHAKDILNVLLTGIKEVPDTGSPVVEGSQQIFAGMTYGKDGNMSEFISEDKSKTYRA